MRLCLCLALVRLAIGECERAGEQTLVCGGGLAFVLMRRVALSRGRFDLARVR